MPDFLGSLHYPLAIEPWCLKKIAATPPDRIASRVDSIRQLVENSAALGYRPLPQARRFHESKSRIRLNVGGNRSSKSYSLVQEVFWRLTNTHPFGAEKKPGGISAWYATKSYELVGSTFWPSLERLLKGGWAYEPQWIKKAENIPRSVTVHLKNGATSLLTFKAYEQGRETFQAAALDLAALDEQPPQDIWLEILTRIGSGKKLLIIAGFTPIIPQPWMEEKVNNPSPDTAVFNYPLDDNRISVGGFLEDAEIDGMIAEWPDEVVETRRNGRWGSFVGTIFQSFNRDAHVIGEAAERERFLLSNGQHYSHLPPTWRATGAIDWGGANPFVFLWGVRLPHLDNAWYIFDEYYHRPLKQGQKRLEEHATEIKRRTEERWQTTLERTWADHDPTNAYEMANYGVPSQPADKEVLASIEFIQTLLKVRKDTGKPRLFIAERCKTLIEEIRSYRWAQGTDKKDAREEPVKLNDHAVDACRYLVFSSRDTDSQPRHVNITNPANRRRF